MRSSFALAPLFALLIGVGVFAAAYTRTNAEPAPTTVAAATTEPQVKLAVLVVFDQMRGDYPSRWRSLFGPGGFARLQTQGAWFTRCYYPYGTTTTGPGHASILSGTCMDKHGIVNNNWYENGKNIYCASDSRYTLVPQPDAAKPPPGGTPDRLMSETVADSLKKTAGNRSKVFGLSLKDRSAILPTGHQADGAFWFDGGRFVTSTYYTDHLDRTVPAWVNTFNKSGAANRWFGKTWTRLRPSLDYTAFSGPDDVIGEGTGVGQGRVFPHPMGSMTKEPAKSYYGALATSPYGNELLLEFAKTCIAAEKLGTGEGSDLLVVSFSSTDLVGHIWGPDSQEVLDVTLRADAVLAELLRYLDAKVGAGKYVMAVTADHGVCPMPEVSTAKGQPAKRVNLTPLQASAEKHLNAKFGSANGAKPAAGGAKAARWIESFAFPWVYLNPRLVAASGKSRAEVARELADYLAQQSDVDRVYTRDQWAGEFPSRDDIDRRVKRAFYPARCGDVYVVLNPFDLPGGPGSTGTTHGSPHGYDAWVPLFVYGPGIPGGKRTEPVTPQATAAIFARYLGVRPPADADFPVPATLNAK